MTYILGTKASQPKGQRVQDKIDWALAFLAEYGYQAAALPVPVAAVQRA